MATETNTRPTFTTEQKEAWLKAKFTLKSNPLDPDGISPASRRALHIAMSELRAENGRKHKGPIETLPKAEQKRIQYGWIRKYDAIEERVSQWKQYLKDPSSKKLYIIIRPDLTQAQKAVQASHAAAQFQKEHPFAPWINGTMVLLEPNLESTMWKRMLEFIGKETDPFEKYVRRTHASYETFWREPDMKNKLTAYAATSDFRSDQIGSRDELKLI